MRQAPVTVVTGWSPAGWTEYASACVPSWCRRVLAYTEDLRPYPGVDLDRRLLQGVPGWGEFLERALSRMSSLPRPDGTGTDKPYNHKFDAIKFARQAFIAVHAAECLLGTELMAWLDADVRATQPLDDAWLSSLLPDGYDYAYLGRATASEIGCVVYRLPACLPMLQEWVRLYTSGDVYELPRWDSSHTWDLARSRYPSLRGYSWSDPRDKGHVWPRTVLAERTEHLKGTRKAHANR